MYKLSLAIGTLSAFAAAQSDPVIIRSDTYFYGDSPPVYPAPIASGSGDWAAAYTQARAFVSQLTTLEKQNLTFGYVSTTNGCSGNIQAVPRLGFPGLCLNDAGNGVRGTDFVNGYPSGVSVGASWNRKLTYDRSYYMGGEFRTKGVNVALGPVVAPLGRTVEGGRNWEGFTSDPYLSGQLVSEAVIGMQDTGVTACTKHFIGYEQETNRNPLTNTTTNVTTESTSSNIDDKTIHELYLWPFADAVRAGSGSIMCSYNRVNNSYACQNSKTLNGLLKEELGFQGFVVSDWSGQHGGIATADAGLDMAMPDSDGFWAGELVEAVANGTFSEARLDDMVTRMMAVWYKHGQDNYTVPGVGMAYDYNSPHTRVNAKNPASKQTLFDGAVEGQVLLKNTNGALPLKSPQMLSLFGYSAKASDVFTPGGLGDNEYDFLFGYYPADNSTTAFLDIAALEDVALSAYARNGTMISGGGSGSTTPSIISSPFEAFTARALDDNTALFWDFTSSDPFVDPDSDACIVFINAWASEGADRTNGLSDTFSDDLVMNVAATCNNTMVVIHNVGPRLVDAWVDHPNVTAIVYAHLPGQESGRATVSLLYGDENFSGKLPYTVAQKASDYGDLLTPCLAEGEFKIYPQCNYTEGVYIDYKAFDLYNITPQYAFGYGLSYTNFSYSNLAISKLSNASTALYPTGPVLSGGQTDLWDVLYSITASVSNVGGVEGAEVSQLYVGIPGGPVRQLRGFEKVTIPVNQTATVNFELTRRDLSSWDTTAQKWALQSGNYSVAVGSSSRMLPLTGSLSI